MCSALARSLVRQTNVVLSPLRRFSASTSSEQGSAPPPPGGAKERTKDGPATVNNAYDESNIELDEPRPHYGDPKKIGYGWTLYFPHPQGFAFEEPDTPVRERLSVGSKVAVREAKRWLQEQRDSFKKFDRWRENELAHNELRTEWVLNTEREFSEWRLACDADHNAGFTTAEAFLSGNKTAVFRGVLCNRLPKDGKIWRTGWANFMSPLKRKAFYKPDYYDDWTRFSHLVLKVRGDGRTYLLNIHTPGEYDATWHDLFNYPLYTHGGPYWQYERIPFSKFYLSSHGRIQDKQFPLAQSGNVRGVSFTMADRNDGPFHLEIAWVGVMQDATNFGEFAYEFYDTGQPLGPLP